ncbi:hypothetical protein HK096_008890, partial [Nowakowskiella sp. JEL0078]
LETEFEHIDTHARAAPPTLITLDAVIAYLRRAPIPPTATELNEVHLLRLVYAWVCTHIEYDVAALKKVFKPKPTQVVGKIRDLHEESTTAQMALSAAKAVCDGYADLFSDLAKRIGIQNVWKVVGGAKGSNNVAGDAFIDPDNHAWNVVLINGEYRFIDSTWGAGIVGDGKFNFHFEPGYFLTRPKHWIFTHFPVDQNHQYLEDPLTIEEFIQLPKVHPGYLQSTAKLLHPRGREGSTPLLSYYEVNDSEFNIEIELPDTFVLAKGSSWRPSANFIFPASKRSPPPSLNAHLPNIWSQAVNPKALPDQIVKNGPKVEVNTSLKPSDDGQHHILRVRGFCPSGGDGILTISLYDLEKSKALRTYRPDGSYSVSFDAATIAAKFRGPPHTVVRNLLDIRIRNCGVGRNFVAPVKQMDTGGVLPTNAESMELISPLTADLSAGKDYDFLVDVTYLPGKLPSAEGAVLGLILGGRPVDLVADPNDPVIEKAGKRVIRLGAKQVSVQKGRVMIGLVTTTKKIGGGTSFAIKGVASYNVK